MNDKIHYDKLIEALKDEKLIILQYSSTSIKKEKTTITSVFAIDYFTDEEWYVLGNDPEFRSKVTRYLNNHENYYFLFMNYNINYSFQKFDLGFDDTKLDNLQNRCIDLDGTLEFYAQKKGYQYIQKPKGGFDTRYYLALLNNIELNSDWIWGKFESYIKDCQKLKHSSRIKAKVMVNIVDKFGDDTLNVIHDKKILKQSKKIMGLKGILNMFKGHFKKLLFIIVIYLLGFFTDVIKALIIDSIMN